MSRRQPTIRIDFYITGDHFDAGEVTKLIGIKPTKTRKREDCPVAATALTYWKLSTEDSRCKAVSWQMKKMVKLLEGKTDIINTLINQYNLETSFTVVVGMKNGGGPELVLDKELVEFISSIHAEIGFDLYID